MNIEDLKNNIGFKLWAMGMRAGGEEENNRRKELVDRFVEEVMTPFDAFAEESGFSRDTLIEALTELEDTPLRSFREDGNRMGVELKSVGTWRLVGDPLKDEIENLETLIHAEMNRSEIQGPEASMVWNQFAEFVLALRPNLGGVNFEKVREEHRALRQVMEEVGMVVNRGRA